MPQQNLFPHEIGNGNQSQKNIHTAKAGQSLVRRTVQTIPNRQATEQRSQSGYSRQAPKLYPEPSRQAAAVDPATSEQSQGKAGVRLFGWIGRYFEVKRTQSGVLRATFSMATPKTLRDQAGRSQKTTVWQRVVVWGESAKALDQQLQTGARVHVEGKFKTREWTDSEGILHTTTELVARNVRFLDATENEAAA